MAAFCGRGWNVLFPPAPCFRMCRGANLLRCHLQTCRCEHPLVRAFSSSLWSRRGGAKLGSIRVSIPFSYGLDLNPDSLLCGEFFGLFSCRHKFFKRLVNESLGNVSGSIFISIPPHLTCPAHPGETQRSRHTPLLLHWRKNRQRT